MGLGLPVGRWLSFETPSLHDALESFADAAVRRTDKTKKRRGVTHTCRAAVTPRDDQMAGYDMNPEMSLACLSCKPFD